MLMDMMPFRRMMLSVLLSFTCVTICCGTELSNLKTAPKNPEELLKVVRAMIDDESVRKREFYSEDSLRKIFPETKIRIYEKGTRVISADISDFPFHRDLVASPSFPTSVTLWRYEEADGSVKVKILFLTLDKNAYPSLPRISEIYGDNWENNAMDRSPHEVDDPATSQFGNARIKYEKYGRGENGSLTVKFYGNGNLEELSYKEQ